MTQLHEKVVLATVAQMKKEGDLKEKEKLGTLTTDELNWLLLRRDDRIENVGLRRKHPELLNGRKTRYENRE